MAESVDITFHVPDDPAFLAAVARVTICHAHLDYCLRLCIKSLAGLSIEEALDATEHEGSRALRERIRKLARMRLGEGQPLLKLQALMKRCEERTEERNRRTHNIIGIWHYPGSQVPMRRTADHCWESLPSAKELDALATSIMVLGAELNRARLNGWLDQALQKRPLAP